MTRKGTRMAQLLGLAALVWLAGCGGNSTMSNGPVVSTPRQFGSLEFTLSATKAVYAPGEQVPLTFTVKNVGTQTVTVTISACDPFDTQLIQAGQTLWQRSQVSGCGGSVTQVSILPGETKTYSYAWDQEDVQGNQVQSGRYTIKSWFVGYNLNDPTLSPINQETNEFANPVDIIIQTL